MGRDQGNQGRGSGNLTDADRSKGGQTSSNEQDRDAQGQFSGTGMGNRQGGMGSEPGGEGGQRRDDRGQFTDHPGRGNQGGSQNR